MRQTNYLLIFFLENGKERGETRAKKENFSLEEQKETHDDKIWEQFVRNSSHNEKKK